MAVKRKAVDEPKSNITAKKRAVADIKTAFRNDLFESRTVKSFHNDYAKSGPYPHAVVSGLVQEDLLRDVRGEIKEHIHFTLKETDIYRIHQSGDLANLSKLDKESLTKLPSLVRLRDALYSSEFREWVSEVTGAGKLSGEKTDMAVNVYTPGSYLLCHDDVIGSRRVSYILYLTDPDNPWKPEYGGGLRLYPTEPRKNTKGEEVKVPLAEWNRNIPPSAGQLSFFAVRPGESYHDVEEVYHGANAIEDRRRIRMAVSGWFHIPQEGEEGYEEGLEQAQAQKSSLAQLRGAADEFDEPQTVFRHFDEPRKVMNSHADGKELDPGDREDGDDEILTEQDLTFLLQYIAPGFLVPDKLEELSESFEETSMLQLQGFLSTKFAEQMKTYVEAVEASSDEPSGEDDHPSRWKVARPPHKHRYAYMQEELGVRHDGSPISKILIDLLHSHAFKKWLALATGLKTVGLVRQHAIARRFRRGNDYALASTYTGEDPRLEFTISLTPTVGWEFEGQEHHSNGKAANGQSNGTTADGIQVETGGHIEFGGEEVYMAGEDEDEHKHSDLPSVGKKAVHDPAVYRTGADDDDDDDGILFTNGAGWNQFSVVLRDKGTMRFVKYVSHAAVGDRWDVKGEVELAEDAFAEDEDVDRTPADNDSNGENEEVDEEEGLEEDYSDDDINNDR